MSLCAQILGGFTHDDASRLPQDGLAAWLRGHGAAVRGPHTRVAAVARARHTILVVVELTGGNDGMNTVIPYADDLYHKARPTLRQTKQQVLKLNDEVGLHATMTGLNVLREAGHLAVVQGVGYPNPDQSHFESMDIWHSADPKREAKTGWLGRATAVMENKAGGVPDPARRPRQGATGRDRRPRQRPGEPRRQE